MSIVIRDVRFERSQYRASWTMGAVSVVLAALIALWAVALADGGRDANEDQLIRLVASLAIATFSVGVAIGSVVINTLLKGEISARYAPASVIAMGASVVLFSLLSRHWTPAPAGTLYTWLTFLHEPRAIGILLALLAIAVFGGMFVVPLYAFLTTTVEKDQTARTVAANNIVNCAAMTIGSAVVLGISSFGVTPQDMLFVVAAMCLVSAWLAYKLHRACDEPCAAVRK